MGAQVKVSPVEVLRAADGHQAVSVGQLREAADLVVFLKRGSDGHDDDRVLIGNTSRHQSLLIDHF